MRASVLTDARLVRLAGQFAWLDIDTERPGNFGFVERFPIEAWPTILVIDPASERVVLRWMGTATAEELEALLTGASPAAAEALLQTLSLEPDPAPCVDAARHLLPTLPAGPAAARVAAAGLGCACSLDEGPVRAAALASLEPAARGALRFPGVLSDDRVGLFDALLKARRASRDQDGIRRVAGEWLDWIEAESGRAATPLARSALDGARLTAAMALGQVARVLPALEASVRALPGQSFALAYLARGQLEAGRPREAAITARAAAALTEGPRKVSVLLIEARARRAAGDAAGARATAEAALRHGEGLPEAVRPRGALRAVRALRDELAAGASNR